MSDKFGHNITTVLLFVIDYHRRHGYGPGYKDLMNETNLSRSTIHHYVHRLEAAGLLAFEPYLHGTMRPTVTLIEPS